MASAPPWLSWAVYLPLGAAGAAWAFFARGAVLAPPGRPWLSQLTDFPAAAGLALALGLALVTIVATRLLVAHAHWARELHVTLRGALLGTTAPRVAQLALLSALSEELLFRAALLPQVGIVASSMLFGLVHVAPRGSYVAWALWATLMGGLFGLLYLASGTLLSPILAHAVINYENMQYIIHYDPTPLDTRRPG